MIERKNKINSRTINLHLKHRTSTFYYGAEADRKSGSALAYALIIMSVSMIILVSLLGYVSSQLKFSFNRAEKQRAFQVAEAGIYFYRWYLAHETSGKTAEEVNNFWQSGTALGIADDYESEFEDTNGAPIGRYRVHVEQPDSGSTIVIAQSTGWTYKMPEVTKSVQVRFRRPSWSENVMMANDFMRFGEGTDVYGRIHSNKGVRFDGTAYNLISSSVGTFDDPDHSGINEFGVHTHRRPPPLTGTSASGLVSEAPPTDPVPARNDVFLAGRQFPISEISFTGVSSDLTFLKKTACNYNEGTNTCTVINSCTNSGCYFDSSGYGRRIVFNANGTMSVRVVNNYDRDTYDIHNRTLYQGLGTISNQSSATTYAIPNNGIIFVENNVWVEGSINNKRITVAAANLIAGASPGTGNAFLGTTNLTYADFNKDNCLGVIAQNSVEILQTSQNYLTISAALLAQNGRVGRKYYTCDTWRYDTCTQPLVNGNCVWPGEWRSWTLVTPDDLTDDVQRCSLFNSADYKNTITVNGSMATNLRYGFAYTNGTGYTNRILNFDNNLIYYPPPYFPTGTEYSIDLWEEL